MSFKSHRERLFDLMEDNSIVISYAGAPVHTNEDDYYSFDVNSQFFYLTGLMREGMILLMSKLNGECAETVFIEESDPLVERWTGKMPTKEDVREVSGAENVAFLPAFDSMISRMMTRSRVAFVYMDVFSGGDDLPDYNHRKALEFHEKYPAAVLKDLRAAVIPLREEKDEDEISCIRSAIQVTRQGLEFVMKNLKPGKMEYEVQADFEYKCKCLGTRKFSFSTIAGSGINGCMMHYGTNDHMAEDGKLILLDLGAKYGNYCSDITRTYPVNGRFTERQREYYDLVLKANRAVAEAARPGITLKDLNDLTKQILGEGLVKMGKISSVEEVGKYYMHSVSHAIGIDCHDCCFTGDILQPGWVISDEPGLYIDEEEIGIRIEDDLLITESGCEVLSSGVIRDPEEIEAFMK